MKIFKFWIEVAKGFLNVWDDVTTNLDYSPFTNGKAKTNTKTPPTKE